MRHTTLVATIRKCALCTLKKVGLIPGVTAEKRTVNRESAGIAPHPARVAEAVLHVYGARASSWRGWLAIHTWIAVKPTGATEYTVYEVDGWRQPRGLPVLRIENDLPDRHWNGKRPKLLKEFRGDGVDALIAAVDRAAKSYPWPETYSIFPGPNCNSFTAWIAANVPELALELPHSAIGSGYTARKLVVDKRRRFAGHADRERSQSLDQRAISNMT